MATSENFADFVCDALDGLGNVRRRKMFGEYMVYLNDKPVFSLCDNTVFAKILPEIGNLMKDCETGFPYEGAKEHYVIDADDREFLRKAAAELEKALPLPKKKK